MDGSSFLASFASDHEIRFEGGIIDTFPVHGKKVTIWPSSGDHDVGSSKLKLTNIVNYAWDHRYHIGQLVAVHKGGVFFAYGVVTPSKNVGVVRVVQRETEERVLIKGMRGRIKDLAFSHSMDSIILGVVDEFANLFVYRIVEHPSDQSLKTELILQIDAQTVPVEDLKYLRLIWCPYLPDEDGDDDSASRLLVVTKNSVADLFNIDMVMDEYGSGPLDCTSVSVGRLKISDHRGAITDASFSPDGTAIATASADGEIKFFQVYMHESESPRCLHQWSPHEGKPVSSIFFLDNHLNHNCEQQFWKYVVTGANRNTELKIWSCASWTCLQTINFAASPSTITELKAAIDLSAKYILVSDIHRRNVYLLKLEETETDVMSVTSVSEFPTPSAFLSMAIISAGLSKASDFERDANDSESDSDDGDDGNADQEKEEELGKESTVIKMLLVQPKGLQECRIIYDGAQQKSSAVVQTFAETFSPTKSPSNVTTNDSISGGKTMNGKNAELQKAADKITLMSPEAFEVKIKKEPREKDEDEPQITPSAPGRGAGMNYLPTRQILAGASGTSSPSREVADILGGGDGDDEIDLDVDFVVTEENFADDDDDSDDSSDGGNILFEEIALKKEEEEFANLDKILLKQEIKTEVEPEPEDDEDFQNSRSSSSIRVKQENIFTPSAPSLLEIKQESLLTSPVTSSSISIVKQEQQRSSPSTSVVKQEPQLTPTTSSNFLSRSFDVGSGDQHLQFNQMSLLMRKLNEMASLIQTQRAEIQILREEVRVLHSSEKKATESLLKSALKNHSDQLAAASQRDTQTIITDLSKTMNTSLGNHLEREVKKMSPFVAQITAENIQQSLTKEVKNRLSRADESLRSAILKMSQSKPAMDAMGQSLAAALQPILQSAFKDMFANIIVPAFEKSMQNMLGNVASTFNKGCKEYESQLKVHVGKQLEPLARDIRESVAKLSSSDQKNTAMERQIKDLEHRILANMKEMVANEIRHAFSVHNANVSRSLSATPTMSPHAGTGVHPAVADPQTIIKTFISQGKWNEAFQTALMANNLSLVVSTCESVNPAQLFNQNPCPLSQSVLLSLIQQLGHNIEDRTELKHRYLEEAIMNLDTQNPSTRQHIGNIMSRLQAQLSKYIKDNPEKKITRSLKMLHMAAQSLVSQN